MNKTRVVIPGWLVLIVVLVILLILFSMPNFIKVKSGPERPYGIVSLDSGVDKQTSRISADYAEGGGGAPAAASSDDTGSRALADQAYYADSSAEAKDAGEIKEGEGGKSPDSKPRFSAATADIIKSWFVPAAYAADHKLDERYLVRTGECGLQVDKYKDAATKLREIAVRYSGMISATQSSRQEDDSTQGSLTLRVPSQNFERAWSEVLQVGKVLAEHVTTEDVSRDYLAYVSKLKNLVSEQAALQNMLDEALKVQRTRGLGEGYKILLDTQERLFNVVAELETTEDSLNTLADQITRSTITVTLTEKNELPAQVKEKFTWNTGTTAATAYHDLLLFLRARLNGLVYFLITCWTWLIPLVLIILLVRWVYRRFLVPRGFVIPALVTVQHGPGGPVDGGGSIGGDVPPGS